jgi:hypothetical protein
MQSFMIITDGRGQSDFIRLLSYVIFPREPQNEERLFNFFLESWLKGSPGESPAFRDRRLRQKDAWDASDLQGLIQQVFWALPCHLEDSPIRKQALKNFERLRIAGNVFIQVLRLDADQTRRRASVRRALYLTEKHLAKSEGTVKTAWRNFGPVSHLYAAMLLCDIRNVLATADTPFLIAVAHELARKWALIPWANIQLAQIGNPSMEVAVPPDSFTAFTRDEEASLRAYRRQPPS